MGCDHIVDELTSLQRVQEYPRVWRKRSEISEPESYVWPEVSATSIPSYSRV